MREASGDTVVREGKQELDEEGWDGMGLQECHGGFSGSMQLERPSRLRVFLPYTYLTVGSYMLRSTALA